ncbi:ACP S-malonyltransferase [bacterium SCSIO 12643]|nr:ACP S-malonyltransferase [bacterium SCSIO 12643]
MKGYVFPGQGAQFTGMGLDLYENSDVAKELFHQANDILGFEISKVMFEGSADELKQTKVTQPAVFLHSVILAKLLGEDFKPDMVAGHSLGEFSALVAAGGLSFENGLKLVSKRALAMQKACEIKPSTMAAIIGLEDDIIENTCKEVEGVVVPANYNSPGQLVISGEVDAINTTCEKLSAAGAKRAMVLPVGGAFHSPLMSPAKDELKEAIESVTISKPVCPIYQNVTAIGETDPSVIKQNLIDQLTAPVLWTKIENQMIADGMSELTEVGPGKVLQGLIKKIDRRFPTSSASI